MSDTTRTRPAAEYGAKNGAPTPPARRSAPYPLVPPGENGAAHRHPDGAYGAAYGAQFGADSPVDAEYVVYRLEEAGTALLCLPDIGHSPRMRTGGLEYVRDAIDSYGWSDGRIRPAIPSAARITRMDEALAWVPLIPRDRVVLRRIVGCRALVSPITERHLFTWRRLASVVGADHKAVQRWHAQGIGLIVAALNGAALRGRGVHP